MHPDADRIVKSLGLKPHPEGGFYRETWRSPATVVHPHGKPRSAGTAIYFLLPAGTFSALHRVVSDEAWHHYDGDPLELHLLDERDGAHRVVMLGRNLDAGEHPQVVVPAGVWQAAVPRGPRLALCGCTVSPGFDFEDFEMPSREALLARFPQHEAVIGQLTRERP